MAEWNYAQWAEQIGSENLKHRLSTGDVLLAQANTLLSILLVGVGGGLGYAARLLEPGTVTPSIWGVAVATAWIAWVAAVLVHQCIATRPTAVPGNAPLNVYKPDLGLTEVQVRAYFMEQVQEKIDRTSDRNDVVAGWLDRCRYAAIATPAVFMLAAWVAGR